MELFTEISLILIVAVVVAALMRLLKQPLIVGYILSGILVGPYAFDLLHSVEEIELFSKIGITILLFIVGLHLSPRVIREVGNVSVITGVGQVLFTSLVGFGIALLLGIDRIAAIYIAIALTFSSTIIILKLLSDRGDLNKLYGKIAIGFLLVQDIIATLILLFVSAFAGSGDVDPVMLSVFLIVKMLILFMALYLVSSYVVKPVTRYIAGSTELLFISSIAWGLGLATLFHVVGFSVEIGALIAGVMLSTTPYAYEVSSRLKPLRDFFIVVFFMLLGSQMILSELWSMLPAALILSLFVLIGNPVIVVILMNLLGFKKKTGFMAGLTVAQISEFSLILVTLGFNFGHIPPEVMSLITLVGLITIAGSTYFILYADAIYPRVAGMLDYLQLVKKTGDSVHGDEDTYDCILFGYDRVGSEFIRSFKRIPASFLVVDMNPASIERLEKLNLPYRFGDAGDTEFLSELPLSAARLIVSTIPDHSTALFLARYIKKNHPRGITIMLASDAMQAEELYEAGVTYVLMPHYIGARHTADLIADNGLIKRGYARESVLHKKYIARHIKQRTFESEKLAHEKK